MKDAAPYAVGIDFGGTSTKIGLVDAEGRVLGTTSFSTRPALLADAWLDAAEKAIGELRGTTGMDAVQPRGIGVGVPGFVDYNHGHIYDLPNVPGWKEVRLGELLRDRFQLRSFVDNDVNVMAEGECTFGAGKAYRHAVFVTLGTGVGGALLMDNRLYRGAYSLAGEMGHISIDMNGVSSPQGRGGLEQYVGNQRIVDRTVEALRQGRASAIADRFKNDFSALTPKVIAEAAASGDALAVEIFDFTADCIATAFASVTYLLQPQVFIVGGGVALSGDVLFEPLRRHLRARLSPVFAERIEVIPAKLGNQAGIIGGATLALAAG